MLHKEVLDHYISPRHSTTTQSVICAEGKTWIRVMQANTTVVLCVSEPDHSSYFRGYFL